MTLSLIGEMPTCQKPPRVSKNLQKEGSINIIYTPFQKSWPDLQIEKRAKI